MSEGSNSLDLLGIKPIGESAKIITKGGVDGASALLSRICLPAAKEIGLLFADHVKAWRAEHAIKIANKTQALLEKQSENSVTAHPRIIYLTFEKGSLSEDDLVQDFWAGLLADITPSSFCLQLYVRSQGYVGSTIDYFGATEKSAQVELVSA